MLSNAQLVTLLATNLNDDRMLSIQAYLTRIIDRKVYGSGIPQYRVLNTVTGAYITSLDMFINAIHPDHISVDYYRRTTQTTVGDVIHPALVLLEQFVVEILEYSDEDDIYSSVVGVGTRGIAFILSYMNESEPLKISDIKLH